MDYISTNTLLQNNPTVMLWIICEQLFEKEIHTQTLSGILAYFSISSISWTAGFLTLSSSPGTTQW